jgi:deoxyribodipyrimidine photo-lyase
MSSKKHGRSDSSDHIYEAPAKVSKQTTSDDVLRHPSIQVAKRIDADTPYQQLTTLLSKSFSSSKPRNVLHWFRSKDLRHQDNRALHAAAEKAKEGSGNLITMYLHSPKDLEWHGTSPARSDLIVETLQMLQKEMEEKNIPLVVLVAEERKDKIPNVLDFVKKHDISHVYANMEYEVDELRRDIKMINKLKEGKEDVGFEVLHDQTIIEPLTLVTGSGTPHKVFTPYHRNWLADVGKDKTLLDQVASPEGNDKNAKDELKELFGGKIPSVPENKQFKDDKEKERIRKLWPAGHDAGMKRLGEFLDKKVCTYLVSLIRHTLTSLLGQNVRRDPFHSIPRHLVSTLALLCVRYYQHARGDGSCPQAFHRIWQIRALSSNWSGSLGSRACLPRILPPHHRRSAASIDEPASKPQI